MQYGKECSTYYTKTKIYHYYLENTTHITQYKKFIN